MESSEDDAGPATNASCRASARERDMGDVDATTSFQHESSEARTSCGTPAMSDLDVDSVPSPSAHDVNTSTDAILDMIDEFVDGPGAPKRIPPRTDDIWPEKLPAPKLIEDQQEFNISILDDRPLQPSLPSPDTALSETVCETSSEKHENESSAVELTSEPTSSIETNPTVSTITDSAPSEPNIVSASTAVETPDNVLELSNVGNQSDISPSNDSNSVVESDVPVPQISTDQTTVVESVSPVEPECTTNLLLDSDKTVPNIVISKSDEVQTNYSKDEIIESNECQLTVSSPVPSVSIEPVENESTECLPATVSHDSLVVTQNDCANSVIESVNENPGERQIPVVNENVIDTAADSPLNKSLDEVVSEPPQVIPSSSDVNTSSDQSECQPQRTVKCDTSGANRDTVTVESAESTSSDIKLEEKLSSPVTKTPLRRRLVRPAPSDRKPDTTVSSSTAETQASDTTVKELVSTESIAKSVSSTSDTVEPSQGIVNQENSSNISDVSVCKAETSSPSKIIKLIRQKTTPTSASSSTIPEKQEITKNEQEPCQSSSDNIPLMLSKHTELKKLISGGEPIIESNRSDEIINSISNEPVVSELSLPIEDECNESSQKECSLLPESSKEVEIKTEEKKVPPLKLNLIVSNTSESNEEVHLDLHSNSEASSDLSSESDSTKQVPKLTIKLGSIQQEEVKSPIPKLTIKPIQPPPDPNLVSHHDCNEQIPSVTKINIKPIIKPPEKVNEIHRKSSSSEISESESSENDDSTSTSDQASTSDQGPSDVVPKVTIKLGKPGTTTEGKFYTEQNVPKLTIKNIHNEKEEHESVSKLKLVINQSEEKQTDKIPKLTIKTVTGKCEGQPMSPKLVIKPIPPPPQSVEYANKDKSDQLESQPIPKLKISTEPFASVSEVKENMHVPKITIKPVTRSDTESVPSVTKLNIKPIIKPEGDEVNEKLEEKVPVVSKLNIKPIIKPTEIDDCTDDIPKVAKLNIKIPKNSGDGLEAKDCDEWNANIEGNSIPIVTKINIKPIVKPQDEDSLKDSENQSSETGNSSDDNTDSIPVVTKINIKPIVKPNEPECIKLNDEAIPVVTKLNIKPVVKPEETSLSSPKKVNTKPAEIPIVTKLNIKPLVKPEEFDNNSKEIDEVTVKNPPLVMKINMKAMAESSVESVSLDKKSNHIDDDNCHTHNNITDNIPVVSKLNIKPIPKPIDVNSPERNTFEMKTRKSMASINALQQVIDKSSPVQENYVKQNCVSLGETKSFEVDNLSNRNEVNYHDKNRENRLSNVNSQTSEVVTSQNMPSVQNCTLLKKLLETKNEVMENKLMNDVKVKISNRSPVPSDTVEQNCEVRDTNIHTEKIVQDHKKEKSKTLIDKNDVASLPVATKSDVTLGNCNILSESVTKPLEISISDKITNQSSGQDSPRIILKINKTDHGASAKIITEEIRRPESPQASNKLENTHELENDRDSQKKGFVNSRRKAMPEITPAMSVGKRLRSSRVVKESDKSPLQKRATPKRPPTLITSPTKEPELSVLESKRIKLGELLSNKSLTITPIVTKVATTSPPNKPCLDIKESEKTVNHSLLNNENRSKNGNSKLQNILSNLHVKQIQVNTMNDINCSEKSPAATPDLNSNTSTSCSSDVIEVVPVEKCPEVQEMLISENSESHDFPAPNDDLSQDPLEVDTSKITEVTNESANIPVQMLTPMPKKRGRPRKTPLSEGARPVTLPTPALEERPVRSLRLSRERPAILAKPRGRGRGRGAKRGNPSPQDEHAVDASNRLFDESHSDDIDPMSSRIKLPRMTEALDKSVCSTPLSSRRRSSEMYNETPELKVVLEGIPDMKSPEPTGRGRGGRGRGRGRTPRGRGRARGGGKGAVYMKETMGIYGRVCGPATTTVELFEEETCMMDDNATPSKPSHLLDEDSQSSVKSSTNESSKMKKSKFADLFDSSKVWTAADVKEYKWPPPELKSEVKSQVMMIQEQVAMFLGVKSFKRRYPELVRRAIVGEEKDYVLSKGLVTEALCDLGITAVDASDVLDVMLSDYPHKYEEYRSHQRQRQIAELTDVNMESEVKLEKIEIAKPEQKPEPPKVDPEKARQEMAAAAIASASEFNARMNASRRTACVDLQSLTICRRRAPMTPQASVRAAPAALYPHALLPGQYQQHYRTYTAQQLRYFPLNSVLTAPPRVPSPTPSSSDSEADWGSRTDTSDDGFTMPTPKRKKLTKVKRSSKTETETLMKEEPKVEQEVEVCRICKLREDINKKNPERFLICTTCNSKLHPSCLDMPGDRSRKVRECGWQCADCKTCAVCSAPQHADKMLFCDLCDRGHHIYCVGLDRVPDGRWHCADCAICKSCGSRDAWGPVQGPGAPDAQWHHQTKRGPGGHKVFSHSLCTPCARAYRIGRYCPLCERSFIGPKGTMQLVICKLCDRQLHQDCVRQSVCNLNVLDYTCGECRRGGITSRAAAVRLAPRTIATLFMAKRRFNKYAHKQYMQRRKPALQDEPVHDESIQEESVQDDSIQDESVHDECSVSDPLEGATNAEETAAAVEALRRDFGD